MSSASPRKPKTGRTCAPKLARKGCDLIVANDVSPAAGVMGGDENTLVIVTPDGETAWPKLDKDAAAAKLVDHLATILAQREGR